MITGFLIALQFLTVIPIQIKELNNSKISWSTVYFPVIGLILGAILATANRLFIYLGFNYFLSDTVVIILLIILTAGLHLDGLSDTVDGFSSGKGKERILEIMRDSHIGAMGVISLISIILLKLAFLYSVSIEIKSQAIILMCLVSRWSLVLNMFIFPYARQEGKAKAFMENKNRKTIILATLITLLCSLSLAGIKGLLLLGIIIISTYLMGRFVTRKIGGITGDTLGATNEINETITLISISLIQRNNLWLM